MVKNLKNLQKEFARIFYAEKMYPIVGYQACTNGGGRMGLYITKLKKISEMGIVFFFEVAKAKFMSVSSLELNANEAMSFSVKAMI